MKLAMRLTLDGLVRVLRNRAHARADERVKQDHARRLRAASGKKAAGAPDPRMPQAGGAHGGRSD
ncbi:hypothetical protein GN330_21750 [Nitratireductor sp. CAU 1489]|uniref:Uncharacterized protein n=1 Tax=Nitratireductor arenosus TaxID=2682096 RepID=A0A844QPY0_9HYPH|nr:hypothetical protein [Nitratireductor arenosus]MVA99881.1 hypothetical protein [Nitratireductor arenosus]